MRNHILYLLDRGMRLDGRKNEEYRNNITVEYGVAKLAEGSARVVIGKTEVIAGIKMESIYAAHIATVKIPVRYLISDHVSAANVVVALQPLRCGEVQYLLGAYYIRAHQSISIAKVRNRRTVKFRIYLVGKP